MATCVQKTTGKLHFPGDLPPPMVLLNLLKNVSSETQGVTKILAIGKANHGVVSLLERVAPTSVGQLMLIFGNKATQAELKAVCSLEVTVDIIFSYLSAMLDTHL